MKRYFLAATLILGFSGLCSSQSSAQGLPLWWSPQVQLTYTAGTTHKIEQVNGDCDWSVWDATVTTDATGKIINPDPVCVPTLSQTVTRADVLGQGLGYSFESDGQLIFLFGDTIGATTGHGDGIDYSPWTTVQNSFQYQAGDTMASSTTQHSEDGLLLNYFLANGSSPSHALVVQPMYTTPQTFPDGTTGTALPMGADDIPNSGINLDGQIYIVANSGTLGTGSGHDHSQDYSVLTKFDPVAQTFAAGRTISSANTGGHFVYLAMQEFQLFPGLPFPGFNDDFVAIFGVGHYRHSNILSVDRSEERFRERRRHFVLHGNRQTRVSYLGTERRPNGRARGDRSGPLEPDHRQSVSYLFAATRALADDVRWGTGGRSERSRQSRRNRSVLHLRYRTVGSVGDSAEDFQRLPVWRARKLHVLLRRESSCQRMSNGIACGYDNLPRLGRSGGADDWAAGPSGQPSAHDPSGRIRS